MILCVPVMMGAALLGLLVEFLQVGSVFAPRRVKPDAARLNPAEGVKKMFSQENLVEVLKSVFKTAALTTIFVLVLFSLLADYVKLPLGEPGNIASAHWSGMSSRCRRSSHRSIFPLLSPPMHRRHFPPSSCL